jgi:hypothetical protein
LGSLGRNANAASGSTKAITGSIVSAILQANLLGQALNAAGNGVQFMMGKFEEAKKIQLDTVSAAGTFAALTGESYKESEKFVVSFGAELSKIAGALPGATADYQKVANSIMDNVIPAFKDANGVLDKGKFKENLTDITKQMTLLGISSGTDASAVGMFTARLLDGNVASAKQLVFADNNPAFINLLEQEMKKRGKVLNDMKNLSAKERIDVVKAVSGKLITKDVIDAASNTVEGLIAGIQSTIFDPTSGVFGLLRDLNTAEGQQNIMTAVASGIKAVMEFFDAGAKLLSALGVPSIDPMLVLYNGINTISSWVKQAGAIIGSITSVAKSGGGGLAGLGALATKYLNPEFLAQKISPLVAKISAFVTPIFQKYLNPEFILKSLSGLAATGLKILAPLAQKFLNPETLLKNFQLLLDGVSGWLNSLFAGLASGSGQLLAGGKGAVILTVIGAKVGWFAGELIWKLIDFIINLPWGNILITIGNIAILVIPAIAAAVLAFQGRVVGAIAQGVWKIGVALIKGLNDVWLATTFTFNEAFALMAEKTNSGINYFWNGWGEVINFWISSATSSFNEACSAASTWIVNFGTQVVEGAANFFNWIVQGISDGWNSMMQAINNAINGMVQQVQKIASDPLGAASSAVTNIGSSAVSSLTQGAGNAASGVANFLGFGGNQAPAKASNTKTNGAVSSVTQSVGNAVSGVANFLGFGGNQAPAKTLNSNTVQRLQSANATKNNTNATNNYAPTLHVYGVTDPQALAQATLDHLDNIFNQQQAATLAP